jgi:cytochrome d ubiquinol oxidase subunit II
MDLLFSDHNLPLIFMGLMGLSILIYVILDGYDLGVGILMARATKEEKDKMIASIGPFWDANETWLVLGVGILLVAFPKAHGIILTSLYIPVTLMLGGLIIRGVSFDFRAKAKNHHQKFWDYGFIVGSITATFSQGYMLGMYIISFQETLQTILFSILVGLCLLAGYGFVGAGWLIMKTEGVLQKKSVAWARLALWGTALGMFMVSVMTPAVSDRIFHKWFSLPNIFFLFPIPLLASVLFMGLFLILKKMPYDNDQYCWVPFMGSVGLFLLGFYGLGYSFYPYIVLERLTIWEAASSPEALKIILIGALVVLPFILGYTAFAYRVFWGKVKDLTY